MRDPRCLWLMAPLCAALCGGCGDAEGGGEDAGAAGSLTAALERLVEEYEVASISVATLRGGQIDEVAAAGEANLDTGDPATPETIYALASVSKPVVGVALAYLIDDAAYDVDLDADVNRWLAWDPPPRNPAYPDAPITLRQLMRHESSLASDADADYETYPKPDPVGDLEPFLQPLLATEAAWLAQAPGEAEAYSNLGVALAARVIEAMTGLHFSDWCVEHLFEPLGMDDTRWFYDDFTPAQQARVARPHDEDGIPYEHYGFEDWPSGQLRATARDYARLLEMLMAGGAPLLSRDAVAVFEGTPLLIAGGDGAFDHSGGEAGVNTYINYNKEGYGYVLLVNSDMRDEDVDDLFDAVDSITAP